MCSLGQLEYLVLDEADRMIEQGHYRELTLILEKLSSERPPSSYRTLVFSATLTLPHRKVAGGKRKRSNNMSGEESLGEFFSRFILFGVCP